MSATEQVIARYEPRGAARELFYARETEVLLAGPAGTGKSRGCLEKLFALALRYPGMRGLIARKTRESLTQSAMVTFEKAVVPPGSLGIGNAVHFHTGDQAYKFSNGSELVVGGLDRPSRIMSTDYDVAYVQEATELAEGDWETITTRFRNGVMPYQQLIADCNPAQPTHWLKQRADRGQVRLLPSRHEDNPALWTGKRWTPAGERYLAVLSALTGVRRLRLLEGRWAAAEGLIYDAWDESVHVIDSVGTFGEQTPVDAHGIPLEWSRYWAVDFGFTNPFVWQAWAVDPDGRLVCYREIYRTQTLVEDHAKRIAELTQGEPRPQAIICDHDAEDRATLERHLGMGTVGAYKAVSPGIQAMTTRLRDAGDGKPRIAFLRSALDARDPALADAKKPCSTIEEFDGYVWAKGPDGKPNKEAPEKVDDHGMDASRYMVAQLDIRGGGTITIGPDIFAA